MAPFNRYLLALLIFLLNACHLPLNDSPGGIETTPQPLGPCPIKPGALKGLKLALHPSSPPETTKGDLALPLTLYLQNLLEKSGARVISTRFNLGGKVDNPSPGNLATQFRAARVDLALALSLVETTQARNRVHCLKKGNQIGESSLIKLLQRGIPDCNDHQARPTPHGAISSLPAPVIAISLEYPPTANRTIFRQPAQQIYQALLSWWTQHRSRVLAQNKKNYPKTQRSPWRPTSFWPVSRPPKTEREVATLIHAWRRGHAVDYTQAWLDTRVTPIANGWALTGATTLPVLEYALKRMLTNAGVTPLHGSLRHLPDRIIGPDPFAIVQVDAALTWRHPTKGAGLSLVDGPGQTQETQALFGEPVWLLDARAGHFLVHAGSGYLGWIKKSAIRRCKKEEFYRRLNCRQAVFSRETFWGNHRIPIGATLPIMAESTDRVELELPDGQRHSFSSRILRLPGKDLGLAAAKTALEALGTPYLWGGRSRLGLDCSGLTQTSWATSGIMLPRDSRMQILCGRLVGTATHCPPLKPGDLLLFSTSSGRIGHVALSLGGSRFVHAVMPEVTIGSLDPKDPDYTPTAKRFVMAKRLIL